MQLEQASILGVSFAVLTLGRKMLSRIITCFQKQMKEELVSKITFSGKRWRSQVAY